MSFIGSAERTSGTTSKLLAGGGEVVNHSSVFAFHGSGPGRHPHLQAARDVDDRDDNACGENKRADCRDQVVERQVADVGVLVDATGHPVEADHVLDQEGDQEADEHQPEAQPAEALAEHPPGDLREPVVDRREDREHRAAHQHEVDVRDHEVGFVDLPVDRKDRQEDARDPADQEQGDEAHAEQQRRLEFDRPAPQRGDPVEHLHARRHRDQERAEHHEHEDRLGYRRGEHVVRPREEAEERDRDGRGGDRLVAEDRLAREHRQDLRDEPEAGQHHDVDLGVPEEPEQVLPQKRRAALGGVEEVRAEVAVGQQHRHRRRDHRHREDDQDRVGEDRPDEQRQAPPAHTPRAHVGDRGVEVDRAEDRGEAGEVDQVDPRVLAAAGRVERVGERYVAGPARFRRVPEDRGVEDDATGQQQPERERVQARVGHVARAHHQRDEVVGQARHHRHDEQEDHRRPVHREQLVVGLGRDQRVVRSAQLQADHQRLDAAQAEEHECRDHVHDPDLLVIRGRDPARPAARLALGRWAVIWGTGAT